MNAASKMTSGPAAIEFIEREGGTASQSLKGEIHPDFNPQSSLLPDRLLTLEEVSARVSLTRTPIMARVKSGTFPAPLRLSPSCNRWRESEISNWISQLSDQRLTDEQYRSLLTDGPDGIGEGSARPSTKPAAALKPKGVAQPTETAERAAATEPAAAGRWSDAAKQAAADKRADKAKREFAHMAQQGPRTWTERLVAMGEVKSRVAG